MGGQCKVSGIVIKALFSKGGSTPLPIQRTRGEGGVGSRPQKKLTGLTEQLGREPREGRPKIASSAETWDRAGGRI